MKTVIELANENCESCPSHSCNGNTETCFTYISFLNGYYKAIEECPKFNAPEEIILTEELIKKGMTNGIGINKRQLELLNVKDTSSGWLKRLIGKRISKMDYDAFIALKGCTK